ncbi:MAG TPA: c-type cytochrome [Gemmatimonadaceae bacterium]|nr:c-type cytochrome [Gemmatimonadaceae bacterium]
MRITRITRHTLLGALGGAAVVLSAACNKERGARADTTGAAAASDTSQETGPAKIAGIASRDFKGDPNVAKAGRALFIRYNCYGCHGGLAGGAMGPSLRDTLWKFGGRDAEIHASIKDGRPMGMPKWAGMLTDQQIDTIVTYIHSLRSSAEPTFFFGVAIGNDSTRARADTAAKAAKAGTAKGG